MSFLKSVTHISYFIDGGSAVVEVKFSGGRSSPLWAHFMYFV